MENFVIIISSFQGSSAPPPPPLQPTPTKIIVAVLHPSLMPPPHRARDLQENCCCIHRCWVPLSNPTHTQLPMSQGMQNREIQAAVQSVVL